MLKSIVFSVFVVAVCDAAVTTSVDNKLPKGGRQKRLLFYDEEGNLVKTYKNPYLYNLAHNADSNPFLRNFFNPLSTFMRPSYSPIAYMIPVSEEVIQAISRDPIYQNRLLALPKKELLVEPNPECAGKRTQLMTKSCSNFLNCWDGYGFEQECPEGLVFSRDGYCDYPHNVDCSSRTNVPMAPPKPMEPSPPIPPQAPMAPSPPMSPSAPIQQAPMLPPAPIQQAPMLPPAPIQQAPMLPPAPIQQAPMLPPAPEQPELSYAPCSKDYEAIRSTTQCAEFYVCVDKVPYRFRCPADLYFNQELGVCDYAHRVNCNDSVTVQAANIVMQSRPVPCVGEPSDSAASAAGRAGSKASQTKHANPFDKQSSSQVAISRQDALHKLQLGNNRL